MGSGSEGATDRAAAPVWDRGLRPALFLIRCPCSADLVWVLSHWAALMAGGLA